MLLLFMRENRDIGGLRTNPEPVVYLVGSEPKASV